MGSHKILWKYEGEGQLGLGSAELPEIGDDVGRTFKGREGVSSHCRGRITWTSLLIGCRSQRRESRRFRDFKTQVRIVNMSLMPAQKTERGAYFLAKG